MYIASQLLAKTILSVLEHILPNIFFGIATQSYFCKNEFILHILFYELFFPS